MLFIAHGTYDTVKGERRTVFHGNCIMIDDTVVRCGAGICSFVWNCRQVPYTAIDRSKKLVTEVSMQALKKQQVQNTQRVPGTVHFMYRSLQLQTMLCPAEAVLILIEVHEVCQMFRSI